MLQLDNSNARIVDDNAPSFETIDLDSVTGGAIPWRKIGKYIPGVGAVLGAYDAYDGYSDWRAKGHGVPESVARGAVEWLKSATYYDLWGSTPAY